MNFGGALLKSGDTSQQKAQGIMLERIAWSVGAVAGIFGGAYTQLTWVMSDDTTLNWTIPVQHHFNAAGLWHALPELVEIGVDVWQGQEINNIAAMEANTPL